MALRTDNADARLRERLVQRAGSDADFWSFTRSERGRGGPEPYQYPAMMVSPMQGELLALVCDERGGRPLVFDPFVGSGTTLAEAMRLGCAFVGCDINPLAVLLATVKAESSCDVDVHSALSRVLERADRDSLAVTETGAWVQKWFRPDVAQGLSAVRRAVRDEEDPRVRRALWLALAEVVRTSGNMRIGRPKLQTRPTEQLGRRIDVLDRMRSAAEAVIAERSRHGADVALHMTAEGDYSRPLALVRTDVKQLGWPSGLPPADVVITSPPYGDNHTTMPYGQQSYLPLRWLDVDDIDPGVDRDLLSASKTLDTRSLGGSRRVDASAVARASAASDSLSQVLRRLLGERDGWTRVASFFADLDAAWERIVALSAADAHFVITLGNRTVSREHVPTVSIVRELLEARGLRHVTSFDRSIGRGKRLAPKNGYAPSTIARETVLIMRRADV